MYVFIPNRDRFDVLAASVVVVVGGGGGGVLGFSY